MIDDRRRDFGLILCCHFVRSVSTELLELNSENPTLHVVFIPGNPGIFRIIYPRLVIDRVMHVCVIFFSSLLSGIVSYYKDFVEELFQRLEEKASVTGKELTFVFAQLHLCFRFSFF